MKRRTSDYFAGCAGKVRFDRRSAADLASRFSKTDAYRCRWCNAWHVGEHRMGKTAAMIKAENKRANRIIAEEAT